MLEKILIPDIGEYSEVAIIDIAVKVGDVIKIDAELMTLETDKASMEIPAPKDGIIKELLVKVGDKVSKGSAILMLETETETETETKSGTVPTVSSVTASSQQVAAPAAPVAPKTVKQTVAIDLPSQSNAYAGPGVRRYARELGVDLNKVPGSGRKERILVDDVQDYVKQALQNNSVGGATPVAIDFSQFGKVEKQALSRIQKISGAFLHRNWVTIPHVTQFDEADITELELFRQGQRELAEKKGVKLTPVVFLMKAIVAGLKQFPKFNSSLSANGEELILKQYFNIGVAVDTPAGLVVPVFRDVDKKGLFELAADLAHVGKKARDGKLTAADMQGGCFTISSLGGIGGTAFTPIINAPEVAILGVSKSQTKPIYNGTEFTPRLILPLSLSYDHRVIDGADAVRFTSFIVELLSDIRRLLL